MVASAFAPMTSKMAFDPHKSGTDWQEKSNHRHCGECCRRLNAGIEILNVLARGLLGLGTYEHRASAKLRTLERR